MINKYYNVFEFNKINKLIHNCYFEQAIYAYQQYIEKYPNDYCAKAFYIDAFIKSGKLEIADELLDSIVFHSSIPELAKQDLILMRIKLLSCQEKYGEALELFRENIEIFEKRNWYSTETLLFLKKKCGYLFNNDYKGYSYRADQVINYSEQAAIECIRKCRNNEDNDNPYSFNENFLLEGTYYKLRNILPLEKRIYNNIMENIYIFRYDNCGKVNGKLADYLEVIVLQGSNDILTMYPYENIARIECIDLTPKVEELPKVKRMSQIDKFNQRYSKN